MSDATPQERLENELGFSRSLAFAYVRARGRCEYCGLDLLMSRQGYASAELDHLLPQSKYKEYVSDNRNLVLSCRTCNGVKGSVDLLGTNEDAEEALSDRELLVNRARRDIAGKMALYDENWRRATDILHSVWWRGDTE